MLTTFFGAAGSAIANMIEQSPPTAAPPSFDNGASLYLFNLFLMTATTFLGAMLVGKQGSRIWTQRFWDHPLHPVTLYRLVTFCAGVGITLRCGAEAMFLWGWNPEDVITSARVSMAPAAPAARFTSMILPNLSLTVICERSASAPARSCLLSSL